MKNNEIPLAATVNGRGVAFLSSPALRLSEALRDELGLTGTKVGCDAGDCGAWGRTRLPGLRLARELLLPVLEPSPVTLYFFFFGQHPKDNRNYHDDMRTKTTMFVFLEFLIPIVIPMKRQT